MRILRGAILASTFLAAPVFAGEEVIYQSAPEWVVETDFDAIMANDGPSELLRDWQYRIEGSVTFAFADRAVRIENPQALMKENQLALEWMPDKGDITIHRLEIYRDGALVDLIADGAKFEAIRRELGLERRLLDGALTATMSVPGLREGDVLRLAYTVSTDDQALGEEVQVAQYLPSEPWQVGQARTIVSWPKDTEMFWGVEDRLTLEEPETRGGYKFIEIALPLAEIDNIPADAPYRFRRPTILRVSSFADWNELSQIMSPHFDEAATLSDNSPIAQQAREIMERTTDPLERAALATQLVQDEISYLLNGLDGGNYLPQSAEETWKVRYGDCKAKTVLLLALLREMGIDAEPALVHSRAGDAIPELLPIPGAFDHVIIHSNIDGTDYWLDGTSTAARLANIGDVPPFFWALPLRETGSGLMEMVQRDPARPLMTMDVNIDGSAGVDLPTLISLDLIFSGPSSAFIEAMVDEQNPQALRNLARRMSGSAGSVHVSDVSVSYDDVQALGTIHIEGVAANDFTWEDGRLRQELSDLDDYAKFNPDRARRAWREIPVLTNGPSRQLTLSNLTLPNGGEGFTLEGDANIEAQIANSSIIGGTQIDSNMVVSRSEVVSRLAEIPASQLAEAKRDARRLGTRSLELLAPQDVTWRWELTMDEREERTESIYSAYTKAIHFADPEDFTPLQGRAIFRMQIYDFKGAKEDLDWLVDDSPSAWAFGQRSAMFEAMGDKKAAIADLYSAWDLSPDNTTAFNLVRVLNEDGQLAEARDLLESLPIGDDDLVAYADSSATLTALEGDPEGGLALLANQLLETPQDAELLNSDCWYRGLFNVGMTDALQQCTLAVERAQYQANALDSRALVRYRQGDLAGALVDLDAALGLIPGLSPSLFLRGIIRQEMGDNAGKRDIEMALQIMPHLADSYARYGLVPAT